MKVELVVDSKSLLGEGAIWHAKTATLYWVDIERHHLYVYDPGTRANRTIDLGQRIGTVVPKKTGGLLLALEDGFSHLDLQTETITKIVDPEADIADNRFNDGKCDPAGRFWAGTVSLTGKRETASVYRLDKDYSVSQMISRVSISNGIVWSLDKSKMYYIDTPTQQVAAYDYDDRTGGIANRTVAVTVPRQMGLPDGMTIDAQGKLWIALFGGSAVTRWDPDTSKLLEKVTIPVQNVTSCALGGELLQDMYVTTAREGMTEEQLRAQPQAGGLYRFVSPVAGLPAFEFDG